MCVGSASKARRIEGTGDPIAMHGWLAGWRNSMSVQNGTNWRQWFYSPCTGGSSGGRGSISTYPSWPSSPVPGVVRKDAEQRYNNKQTIVAFRTNNASKRQLLLGLIRFRLDDSSKTEWQALRTRMPTRMMMMLWQSRQGIRPLMEWWFDSESEMSNFEEV